MQVELDKNPELKAELPQLQNVSQENLQKLDSFVKKDPSGNEFVNPNDLKTQLGFSDKEVKEVQKTLEKSNKTPIENRDGTLQSTMALSQTDSIKTSVKNEDTPIEKLSYLFKDFGSIKVEAGCSYSYSVWNVWGNRWTLRGGFNARINDCMVQQASSNYNYIASIATPNQN